MRFGRWLLILAVGCALSATGAPRRTRRCAPLSRVAGAQAIRRSVIAFAQAYNRQAAESNWPRLSDADVEALARHCPRAAGCLPFLAFVRENQISASAEVQYTLAGLRRLIEGDVHFLSGTLDGNPEQIYPVRDRGGGRAPDFFQDRSLRKSTEKPNGQGSYERQLGYGDKGNGEAFPDFLKKLGPRDTWIDMGAGHLGAIAEYFRSRWFPRKAKVRAVIAEEAPRDTPRFRGRDFRLHAGRTVETIPNSQLGKARLITDVMGPLSYSDAPDAVLRKYASLLTNDGRIYTQLNPYGIQFQGGGTKDLFDWIRQFRGIRLVNDRLGYPTTMPKESRFVVPLVFERVPGEDIYIPPLLLTSKTNQLPPTRRVESLYPPE